MGYLPPNREVELMQDPRLNHTRSLAIIDTMSEAVTFLPDLDKIYPSITPDRLRS